MLSFYLMKAIAQLQGECLLLPEYKQKTDWNQLAISMYQVLYVHSIIHISLKSTLKVQLLRSSLFDDAYEPSHQKQKKANQTMPCSNVMEVPYAATTRDIRQYPIYRPYLPLPIYYEQMTVGFVQYLSRQIKQKRTTTAYQNNLIQALTI